MTSPSPRPGSSIGRLDRWTITARLLSASIVAVLAIGAVGLVSLRVITRERTALENLTQLSRTQRILQDADMEHDTIRADVFLVLLDVPRAGNSSDAPLRRLTRSIDTYHHLMATARTMPVADDLRLAIQTIEPEVDAYVAQAADLGHLAVRDRQAAMELLPEFQNTFSRLADQNLKLTDLFASRALAADVTATANARTGLLTIALAGLCAAVFVALAGRLLTTSVSKALGRVRRAAELISDGDLSIRSEILAHDDIGAVAAAVNRMAETLHTTIVRLRSEQEQDVFSRQFSEVLDMADTEVDTYGVVARGMAAVAPELPMELLLADSSRAHMERATTNPGQDAPCCTVESPYGCMAVRRGSAIVFDSSDALNACAKLRNRPSGQVSAVCVPLSFMGRSLGVLHAAGPVGHLPPSRVVKQLTTLGILAGSRIGTVRAFERTQTQARTDSLTGMANRRALELRIRGFSKDTPFALILADLDHFKRLNDTHGHDAGDQALRVFADVLRRSLRNGDHSARWGGEEFMIVLEGRDASSAEEVVARIRASLATACEGKGAPSMTASFGIADTTMARDFEQLVSIADEALYQSKDAGRDRSTIGDPLRVKGSNTRHAAEPMAAINVVQLLQAGASRPDRDEARGR